MEWLATSVDDDFPERDFYLCPSNSLDEVVDKITPRTPYFGFFVLMDARGVADDSIKESAKKLLAKGLVCLCAWGPDCERVHDLFDAADDEIHPCSTYEDFVMTTWQSRDTLEEALWYFVRCGMISDKYEMKCKDWIIAPIENPEWEQEVRSKISKVNAISEDD
ncbi:MAG: hypothetical protein LAN83_01545 [Acidobacteriia bacterium]|nr:hypothetical protein [Terriglobia bacterium]